MTNNQTIDGVPRELLERLQIALSTSYCPEGFLLNELRALLDAPKKTIRIHADGSMAVSPKPGSRVDMLVAQSKVEPVAWETVGVNEYGLSCRKAVTETKPEIESVWLLWGDRFTVTQRPLYAEQPAPVAVVLPGPFHDPGMLTGLSSRYAQGWNACIDEVKSLNGSKP